MVVSDRYCIFPAKGKDQDQGLIWLMIVLAATWAVQPGLLKVKYPANFLAARPARFIFFKIRSTRTT